MKEILVQLDASERASVRLNLVCELAARFGAEVTGLFAHAEHNAYSTVIRQATDAYLAAAESAKSKFQAATAEHKIPAQWFQLAHGNPEFVVDETTICARYADLVLLGQWEREVAPVPENLCEQVILHGGRPVLVIPYAGEISSLGRRIVIAWNASREATRAVHDALPFLKQAEEVVVLAVRKTERSAPSEAVPQVDIVRHLSKHGVKAQLEHSVEEDVGVMDLLLSRCFDLGADLLVMGAHSGFGAIPGSGTRFMLRHLTLPVLFSN